jgi:KUP system potassium uptake protein
MSYFPKVKLVHTSDKFHGQIYIPLVNWLMMIGTVIVTAVYHNVRPPPPPHGIVSKRTAS